VSIYLVMTVPVLIVHQSFLKKAAKKSTELLCGKYDLRPLYNNNHAMCSMVLNFDLCYDIENCQYTRSLYFTSRSIDNEGCVECRLPSLR
jgi:hypothetical protein